MIIKPPPDGWKNITPRRWQDEAYGILLQHFGPGVTQPTPAMIQAIMGSGKSKLMAQLAASSAFAPKEHMIVSTSSIYLVRQLEATFRDRLEGSAALCRKVGTYYTHGKDLDTPIIITCMPSVPELAMSLQRLGRTVSMWMADEAHRTETKTIKDAHGYLLPMRTLGATATAYRAQEEERLTLFEKLLCCYGAADAIRDGKVVVPWRIVSWTGGETTLDEACVEMTRFAKGPGMFNAACIEDAENFAKKVTATGMATEAIHSRLKGSEVDARLRALEHGELKAVVHVAMLQEGADFPWLRWLCLRRPVGSRVRFAQEVGRTLRYWVDAATGEEKTEAILYDPHGLFQSFRLEYESLLGGQYETDKPDEADEGASLEQEMEQSVFDLMRHLNQVMVGKEPLNMTPLGAYLTEVVTAFDICGLIQRKIAGREWRQSLSSEKQQRAVSNLKWASGRRCVPRIHQRALAELTKYGAAMNKGTASDLISVLMSLADKKKWPDLKHIDQAAEEGIARHETKMSVTVPDMPEGCEPPPEPPPPMTQGYLFEGTQHGKHKAAKKQKLTRPTLGIGNAPKPALPGKHAALPGPADGDGTKKLNAASAMVHGGQAPDKPPDVSRGKDVGADRHVDPDGDVDWDDIARSSASP